MSRRKRSGLRKALRGAYKLLGALNTASYVLGAANNPGALGKHIMRKRISKIGGRIVK